MPFRCSFRRSFSPAISDGLVGGEIFGLPGVQFGEVIFQPS